VSRLFLIQRELPAQLFLDLVMPSNFPSGYVPNSITQECNYISTQQPTNAIIFLRI
jgi:hypothetical protein